MAAHAIEHGGELRRLRDEDGWLQIRHRVGWGYYRCERDESQGDGAQRFQGNSSVDES